MAGFYSERQGRKPAITTAALVELVLRKLRALEEQDALYEAFNSYIDPYGSAHVAWIPDPEEWVITEPGLWRWLGSLERVVLDDDFPSWDEDTLLDVVELYYNQVVSAPVTDADGTFEGFSRDYGRELYRTKMNQALSLRQPPLALREDGRIIADQDRVSTAVGVSPGNRRFDVFLSHAHEDKAAVARPLAEELRRRGHRVFYDEFELAAGESLTGRIADGLQHAGRGIVVLSPAFFAKRWPQRELATLLAREAQGGESIIIPVWHGIGPDDVAQYSPLLADRVALSWDAGIAVVVEGIERSMQRRVRPESHRDSGADRTSQAGTHVGRVRRAFHGVTNWLLKRSARHTLFDLLVVGVIAAALAAVAAWGTGLLFSSSNGGLDTRTTPSLTTFTSSTTSEPTSSTTSGQRPQGKSRTRGSGALSAVRRKSEDGLQGFATGHLGRRGVCRANRVRRLPPSAVAQQICRIGRYTLVYTRLRRGKTTGFVTNRSAHTKPGTGAPTCGATVLVAWSRGLYAFRQSDEQAVLMWSYVRDRIVVRAVSSLQHGADLCRYWSRIA